MELDKEFLKVQSLYEGATPLERLKICEKLTLDLIKSSGIRTCVLEPIKVDIFSEEEEKQQQGKDSCSIFIIGYGLSDSNKSEIYRFSTIKVSKELIEQDDMNKVVFNLVGEYAHSLYFLMFKEQYDGEKQQLEEVKKEVCEFVSIFKEFVIQCPIHYTLDDHTKFAFNLMNKDLLDLDRLTKLAFKDIV